MKTCDSCNKEITTENSYLLTTLQIITSVASWKRFLEKTALLNPNILMDSKAFTMTVALRASSDTPWLICNDCSIMFTFDHNSAKANLKKYLSTGQPANGFALCRVIKQGNETIVEAIDDKAFTQAFNAAGDALEEIRKK